MTAPSTSHVFSKFKINSIFLNNQRTMFSSPYVKILHDPECQSHCCSENFGQSTHTYDCNQMNLHPPFRAYADESTLSSSTTENVFLYYDVSNCNQMSEFQKENAEAKLVTLKTELDYVNPIKRARYDSFFNNINSVESQSQQKCYSKSITKRKRKRTIFSTEQIIVMEGVFKKRPYVTKEERQFLSQQLNINEKAIKIWFQNRRRVTENRDRNQSDSYHSDSTVEEVCNDYNTRLDYIESQIRQNTDQYGFVTLDSKALTELVRIIDSVLSHSIDCCPREIKSTESYLMYEPVSPGNVSDDSKDSENIAKWEPSQPEESLQRLIDIHTVLYS